MKTECSSITTDKSAPCFNLSWKANDRGLASSPGPRMKPLKQNIQDKNIRILIIYVGYKQYTAVRRAHHTVFKPLTH